MLDLHTIEARLIHFLEDGDYVIPLIFVIVLLLVRYRNSKELSTH